MSSTSGPQVLRLPASSPLFDYSPYIRRLDDISSHGEGAHAGWIGVSNANGEELMTYGEDKDGAWIVLKDIASQTFTPFFSTPSPDAYEVTAQIDSDPLTVVPRSGIRLNASTIAPTHQVRLLVACRLGGNGCSASGPTAAFSFHGMDSEVALSPDSQLALNATLDDSSKHIVYQGFAAGTQSGNSIINDAIVAASQGNTLSYTSSGGATAGLHFTGTSIQIQGTTGSTLGTYSVSLDNGSPLIANATRSIFSAQQLMFLASDLKQQEHHVVVSNLEEGKGLALDAFMAWGQGVACFGQGCAAGYTAPAPSSLPPSQTPSPGPPSTNTAAPTSTQAEPVQQSGVPGGRTDGGSNIGAIIGAIFGVLLALVILFVIYRCWRRKRPEKEEVVEINPWDEANMLTKQPNHFVRVDPKEQMPYRYRKCSMYMEPTIFRPN